MKLLSFLTTYSLSLLIGCSVPTSKPDNALPFLDDTPCHGSFYVDDSRFSAAHKEAIQRAALRWNDFVGRDALHVYPVGKCRIFVEDIFPYGGAYRWRSGVGDIVFDSGFLQRPLDLFEAVAMHEMGHSEGLDHIKGPGIMAPNMAQHTNDFTDADRAECVRVGFCSDASQN